MAGNERYGTARFWLGAVAGGARPRVAAAMTGGDDG
jgi:hypothetical protein